MSILSALGRLSKSGSSPDLPSPQEYQRKLDYLTTLPDEQVDDLVDSLAGGSSLGSSIFSVLRRDLIGSGNAPELRPYAGGLAVYDPAKKSFVDEFGDATSKPRPLNEAQANDQLRYYVDARIEDMVSQPKFEALDRNQRGELALNTGWQVPDKPASAVASDIMKKITAPAIVSGGILGSLPQQAEADPMTDGIGFDPQMGFGDYLQTMGANILDQLIDIRGNVGDSTLYGNQFGE